MNIITNRVALVTICFVGVKMDSNNSSKKVYGERSRNLYLPFYQKPNLPRGIDEIPVIQTLVPEVN
jgi:hypothetical protein